MEKYHKYVFDTQNRMFVGDFEGMYKNEDSDQYDSWFQENLNEMSKKISLSILNGYNFESIIDIGCGKGLFTHLLKKENNTVVGLDFSETAIKKARARFPEIKWEQSGISDIYTVMKKNNWEKVSIVVLMEILSYIEDWKEKIKEISHLTDYIYISLDIPENPIGFVKFPSDLIEVLSKYFLIQQNCSNHYEGGIIKYLLGKNKKLVENC